MRKVLTVVLIALLLFAGTGVVATAGSSADTTVDLEEGEISPGSNGTADPLHEKDETTHNPISVGG